MKKKKWIALCLAVLLVFQTMGNLVSGNVGTVLAAQEYQTEIVEAEDGILSSQSDFSTDADAASHGGGHIRTRAAKATVTLTFQGVGIKFYTKKGSGAGIVDVSIDGKAYESIDEYVSGAAQFQTLVFEQMDLSAVNEEHTIVLTTSSENPHGISNPWYNFDYFEVYKLPQEEPDLIRSPGNTAYYLDSNATENGTGLSEDAPFNTLEEINKREFAPGDRIFIKSGSAFSGQLYLKGSGSPESPILVDRYGEGEKPLIDGGGRAGNTPSYGDNGPFGEAGSAVYLLNSQYWEISNLRVTNWSESSANKERSGIRVEAAGGGVYRHIYIKNCEISDVRGFRGQDSIWDVAPAGGGATFYGSRTTHRTGGINICSYTNRANNASDKTKPGELQDSEPTVFDDILIEGNQIVNCDANGITTTNVKGGLDDKQDRHTNVVIRNNTIQNVQRAGIIPLYTSGALVEHNKVDTFQQTTEGYGCGIWCDRADNMIFQYNEICNGKNTMDGMAFNLDDMTENGLIQYNYTHDNVGGGYMLHVRTNSYNRNNTIRYNLSVNDTYNYAAHQAIIVCVGESADTKIQTAKVYNNTFFNTRAVHPVYQGDQIEFSNNIFYLTHKDMKNKTNAYQIGAKTNFRNNLFAGIHPKDEPVNGEVHRGNLSLGKPGLAGALVTRGEGGYQGKTKEEAFASAKLAFGSLALGAGVLVEENGGRDLYGNEVSLSEPASIGAYNGPAAEKFEDDDFWDVQEENGEPTDFDDYRSFYVEGEEDAVTKTGSFITADSQGHGGKHIHSASEDAAVEYTFTGIAFSVYTKTGSGAGVADIYLDGEKVAADDQYAAAEAFQKLAYTKTFEETGTHTVRVVRTGNSNPSAAGSTFNFDCFKIFQEQAPVKVEGTLEKLDASEFSASAESVEENEGPAQAAIDGNENTYWHSNWSGDASMAPDFSENQKNGFTIDLGDQYEIQKLEYLPRRDMANGRILKYRLYYSKGADTEWLGVPRGAGTWADDDSQKQAVFEKVRARRLQIRVFETKADDTGKDLISAAEFGVYQVIQGEPEPEMVTVSAQAGPGGTVEGTATVEKGTEVTLTAKAAKGYHFTGWYLNGEKVSEETTLRITANEDVWYTAEFEKDASKPEQVTISVKAELGGTAEGTATVEKGTKVTLTAKAAPGYQFAGWYLDGGKVSDQALLTIAAEQNAVYAAKFIPIVPVQNPPGKVEKLKGSSTASAIKLTWKKTTGADGYEIRCKDGKNWKVLKNVSTVRYTHKGLKSGTAYAYQVAAYKQTGAGKVYGAAVSIKTATAPGKTVLKVKRKGSGKVFLTWRKVKRADGYRIEQKTGKGKYGKPVLKKASSKSFQVKGLKKGKAYTFRIAAYKKVGNTKKFGTSVKKTVKIQ